LYYSKHHPHTIGAMENMEHGGCSVRNDLYVQLDPHETNQG
jgi:hypothetical protein